MPIRREKQPPVKFGLGLIPGLGQIALVVLKMTGVITWSWWLVMAPLLACSLLLVLLFCGLAVFMLIRIREARRQHHLMMQRIKLATPEIIRLLTGDEEQDRADS